MKKFIAEEFEQERRRVSILVTDPDLKKLVFRVVNSDWLPLIEFGKIVVEEKIGDTRGYARFIIVEVPVDRNIIQDKNIWVGFGLIIDDVHFYFESFPLSYYPAWGEKYSLVSQTRKMREELIARYRMHLQEGTCPKCHSYKPLRHLKSKPIRPEAMLIRDKCRECGYVIEDILD